MDLPLIAFNIGEIRTMACERPAVMQGPLNAAVTTSEPVEEHFDVQIVSVQVV